MKYVKINPNDFQSPEAGTLPYADTLDKNEFEYIAALIIEKSQERGFWKEIKKHEIPKQDRNEVGDMVKKGFLEKGKKGYMLTDDALLKIIKKYPAKEKEEEIFPFGRKYVLPIGDIPKEEWYNILEQNFQNGIFDKQPVPSLVGITMAIESDEETKDYFTIIGLPAKNKVGLVITSEDRKKLRNLPLKRDIEKYFGKKLTPPKD